MTNILDLLVGSGETFPRQFLRKFRPNNGRDVLVMDSKNGEGLIDRNIISVLICGEEEICFDQPYILGEPIANITLRQVTLKELYADSELITLKNEDNYSFELEWLKNNLIADNQWKDLPIYLETNSLLGSIATAKKENELSYSERAYIAELVNN